MTPGQIPDDARAAGNGPDEAKLLVSEATGWYRPWYFRRRLEQEVLRSGRYNRQFALVWLRVGPATSEGRASDLASDPRLNELLRGLVAGSIRSTDIAGELEGFAYGVILPETPKSNAGIVAARLAVALRPYSVEVNVVAFPVDATTAEALLSLAARAAG